MKKRQASSVRIAIYAVTAALALTAASILFPNIFFGILNVPGLILVVGGTAAALLLSHSRDDVRHALRRIRQQARASTLDTTADEHRLLQVANLFRNGRLRQAEQVLEEIDHPLLQQGVQWVLDRTPRDELHKLLSWHIQSQCQQMVNDARILRQMAGFAPALGMLGTLLGLIQMLYGLGDQTLGQMGQSMAFAVTTTLYGLVMANLLLKPLAIKVEKRVEVDYQKLYVLKEAILMLWDRQHPVLIQESLATLKARQVNVPSSMSSLQAA